MQNLPLVVSAPLDPTKGTCLVLGVPPVTDRSRKNLLGKAFEQVTNKNHSSNGEIQKKKAIKFFSSTLFAQFYFVEWTQYTRPNKLERILEDQNSLDFLNFLKDYKNVPLFQSARKTNSRYLLNYFDSSVIELKTEDRFDQT